MTSVSDRSHTAGWVSQSLGPMRPQQADEVEGRPIRSAVYAHDAASLLPLLLAGPSAAASQSRQDVDLAAERVGRWCPAPTGLVARSSQRLIAEPCEPSMVTSNSDSYARLMYEQLRDGSFLNSGSVSVPG